MKLTFATIITLVFFVLGCLWIILTDNFLVGILFPSKPVEQSLQLVNYQSIKGIIFILITSLVIYSIAARYEKRINHHLKIISQTNEDLKLFFYKISHDIREPVVSAEGLIDLASIEKDPKELALYHKMLKKNNQNLNQIVQDFTELSRLVDGKLNKKRLNLHAFISNIVILIKKPYEEIDQDISIDIEKGLEINTDPFLLETILENLIDNALKFQNKNRPLKVLIAASATPDKFLMKIKDWGPGIHPDSYDKIYDLFYREHADRPGVGLGLYIVRLAVTRLNGKISFASDPGIGTEFIVEIPNGKQQDF